MDARKFYSDIREATYQAAYDHCCKLWPDLVGRLRLQEIDFQATQLINDIWQQTFIQGQYALTAKGWKATSERFKKLHHNRIDLAVWCDDQLCAVMLGKPSRKKLVLSIHYLDGDRDDGPLSGRRAEICTVTAELYGKALEVKYVALRNPLIGIKQLYETLGYRSDAIFGASRDDMYKRLIENL